jgi:chemotaxis signal transduction protein
MLASMQCPCGDHRSTDEPRDAVTCKRAIWLICSIGDRSYGVDMRCVQEVLGYERPCSIAGVPAYLVGRIRRADAIIPVIDLRVRLGVSSPTIGPATAIVVVKVGESLMGCVVDNASEAIEVPANRLPTHHAVCRPCGEVGFAADNALGASTSPQPLDVEALLDEVSAIFETRSFEGLRQAA